MKAFGVIQCGRRCFDVGGLKGFSRTCSDVRVDPKLSDGIIGMLCVWEGVVYFELY